MAIILLASELFVNPVLFGQSISSYSDISSCLEDELNEDQIRHIYQTSNIVTLMDHVMLKDSLYVMTISEASIKDLKIKPEEVNFAKKYVNLLNETYRKDTKKE